MRSRRFFHKKSSKNCPPGGVTILGRDEIEGFGVRALDDLLQITDYRLLPEGRMDGVIVTVVHDEFRGMGLSGVSGFLGAGAVVVDVRGIFDAGVVEGMGFYYRRL
ncbi:MAG: hypothetical protein U9N07_02950 [Euryarchaeota archaeon]|nr:hypothetical protein [Euryarchaeota archaeon]